MKKRVALIAHDKNKDDMVALASACADVLRQCIPMATGTTGKRLQQEAGLIVERKTSGPPGGDLQIGAELIEGRLDYVIFLRGPTTSQPHEPDINELVRACGVHNITCATNLSSAPILLSHLGLQLQVPSLTHLHPHS